MKKTDAPSRINAVAAIEINMKLAGSTKELAIVATSALLNDKQPGSMGKSKFDGPWPEEVSKAADQLRSAVEEHLLRVFFEVGDDGSTRESGSAGGHAGKGTRGIVEPAMERASDEPPQL